MAEFAGLLALDSIAGALQGILETLAVERLKQIIQGVHLEGAQGELDVGRHENDGGHGRAVEPFQHAEAVQFRHLHVEKDQIGFLSADRGHCLAAVGALASDFDVGFLLQ